MQGNLQALRDDISNRVEYALWQQRQMHEASLGHLYQQHAQELQAAVREANTRLHIHACMHTRAYTQQYWYSTCVHLC